MLRRLVLLTLAMICSAKEALSERAFGADSLPCLRAVQSLAAGSVPSFLNFEPVQCPPSKLQAAFQYEPATGVTRIIRTINASEIVPGYPDFDANVALPGQPLRLLVVSGAVVIERSVEAVQRAKPGQYVFVKSKDGKVISGIYQAVAHD